MQDGFKIVVEESNADDDDAATYSTKQSTPRDSIDTESPLNPYLLSPWQNARETRKHSLPSQQVTDGITASQVRRLSERGGEGSGPSPKVIVSSIFSCHFGFLCCSSSIFFLLQLFLLLATYCIHHSTEKKCLVFSPDFLLYQPGPRRCVIFSFTFFSFACVCRRQNFWQLYHKHRSRRVADTP